MSFTPVLFESRHIPDESARFVAAVNKLESFGISVSLSAQRGFFTQGVRDSKPFRIRFHLPDRIHNLDLARREQILANDPQTAGVAEIPWQVAGEIRACFHDILQNDFGTHFMMATAWDHSHLDDARGHNTRTKSGSYQVHYAAGGLFYTAGVVFFATDHRLRYGHFVWHLFVLAGTLCHCVAIWGWGAPI